MDTIPADARLIVFVKAPRPGFVKTRLATTVGPETAAEAYTALVETLIARLDGLSAIELKFSPLGAEAEIEPWLRPQWTASPQAEGDLAERLIGAFKDAFDAGHRRVVIIGSDCPYITPDDLRDAFQQLTNHDVVLGPASDGGYWLIGLRQPQPTLFKDIAWSTATVFQETLAAAAAADLRVTRLRELSDVDTLADLLHFNSWQVEHPTRL
jgi:rSAM/selenodomain-associated transferase 1